MTTVMNDKHPTPDPAEDNAFFPSAYSLSQFTASKSDLSSAHYPTPYQGGRWKILVVGADERYLMMDNGTFFLRVIIPLKRFCQCIILIRQVFLLILLHFLVIQ
ncbi:hypothetical protein [Vibrio cholerae]|uniref:hypothetical protein n=1 Tax=Vibrio cholerae TaxID=666 RepID=UPI001FFCFD03|nr:hypothetical protein [Vibrio cholerae]